jgi:Flp pilus assembly protein TadG
VRIPGVNLNASKKRQRSRGTAMLELALLSPWICFLFVGVLDSGFYAYSLITLETATRSAAAFNSDANTPSDSAKACTIVLNEMHTLINMGSVVACGGSNPVSVTSAPVTGPDTEAAVRVTVRYTTPQLIPIPALLAGQFTITRAVTMKL